jgi:hypothetical protein
MARSDGRKVDEIREEIRAERAQLDTALATLGAEAKRSGRIAGSAVAAVGSLLLLARLRPRRRGR